jgi:hypothetical protein
MSRGTFSGGEAGGARGLRLGNRASGAYAAGVKRRTNPHAAPTVERASLSAAERAEGYAFAIAFELATTGADGAFDRTSVLVTAEQLQALRDRIDAALAAPSSEPDFFTGIRETLARHRESLETSRRSFAAQSEERAEREVRQERIEQRVEDKK